VSAASASGTALPPASGGAGRFASCAQTNDGDVSLQFLGRKPPAHRPPLVPVGAEAALICRYAGIGESQPAGALVASLQVGSQQADGLASVIDGSVPLDLTQMPPACPSNAAGVYALQFGYPQGRIVAVTSTLNGCPWTVVGDRAVWTSSVALQAFAALVGGEVSDYVMGPQPAASSQK
jgi:hypothetical protein